MGSSFIWTVSVKVKEVSRWRFTLIGKRSRARMMARSGIKRDKFRCVGDFPPLPKRFGQGFPAHGSSRRVEGEQGLTVFCGWAFDRANPTIDGWLGF